MAKVKIQGHASGTGVLTVTAPNTSSDRTITLPDSTGTLLNSDGDGSSLTGVGVGKNILINGAMQVAQRGTSFAGITGAHSLDRWRIDSNIGVVTITQDSNGPAGFAKSLKFDYTTADASPASSGYSGLFGYIEGQDLQHLKKGTASAESVTVSFWVKCNKTGDCQVNLLDYDNDRLIGNAVTINSADTWEQKSLTFVGDTTGSLDNDNTIGLILEMWFDTGTNYSSGTIPTSWTTKDHTDRAAGVTLALGDSTSNYINITGVKMELGSVATDYEHRSYGTELALCRRYYLKWAEGATDQIGVGFYETASQVTTIIHFPSQMRVAPSLDYVTGTSYYQLGSDVFNVLQIYSADQDQLQLYTNALVSGTQGDAGMLITGHASAYVAFDAEL